MPFCFENNSRDLHTNGTSNNYNVRGPIKLFPWEARTHNERKQLEIENGMYHKLSVDAFFYRNIYSRYETLLAKITLLCIFRFDFQHNPSERFKRQNRLGCKVPEQLTNAFGSHCKN
jgi:hypothetical protein